VRVSAAEKLELIRLIEGSALSIRQDVEGDRAGSVDLLRVVQPLVCSQYSSAMSVELIECLGLAHQAASRQRYRW
jgi:hypothetical protein